MALLWVDGFEQYGADGGEVTGNVLTTKYNMVNGTTVNVVAGRVAGTA